MQTSTPERACLSSFFSYTFNLSIVLHSAGTDRIDFEKLIENVDNLPDETEEAGFVAQVCAVFHALHYFAANVAFSVGV